MLMAKDNYEKLVQFPRQRFLDLFDEFISKIVDK